MRSAADFFQSCCYTCTARIPHKILNFVAVLPTRLNPKVPCAYAHVHMHMHVHMHKIFVHMHVHTHLHMHRKLCICTKNCAYASAYAQTFVHMHVRMHSAYAHVHLHMHSAYARAYAQKKKATEKKIKNLSSTLPPNTH